MTQFQPHPDLPAPAVFVAVAPAGTPERMAQYHAALDQLVRRGAPFVLAVHHLDAEQEPEADRKAAALWFKRNFTAFASLCRGYILIEPDPLKRSALEQRRAAPGAFPIPVLAVWSHNELATPACNLEPPGKIRSL